MYAVLNFWKRGVADLSQFSHVILWNVGSSGLCDSRIDLRVVTKKDGRAADDGSR